MRRSLVLGALIVLGIAGSYPRLLPPATAAYTRCCLVASPTVTWESTSLQEPDILIEAGVWKMWAKAGWATSGLGYYTSATGRSWTPYAGNPVLGAGGSGHAAKIAQPMIVPPALGDGTDYICYFNDLGDVDPNTPRYAISADGITGWALGGSGNYITNPGAITQWGNRHVWREGSSWRGLQETREGGVWKIRYMSSTDGHSWTLGSIQTTLLPAGLANVGGPNMADIPKINGLYTLYYHAGSGSNSDLYVSTASDPSANAWSTPVLLLTHTGSGNEIDQVADPSIIVVGTVASLFYAGVDNTGQTGRILLATGVAAP